MKWFYNLKISVKLIIGFLLVALIAGVVGFIGLVNINKIDKADTLLYEENTLGLEYAGNFGMYFQRIRYNFMKMVAIADADLLNTSNKKIKNYMQQANQNLKLYEDGIITQIDREQFTHLKTAWVKYESLVEDTIQQIESGKKEEAEDFILNTVDPVGEQIQESFDKIFEYNTNTAKQRSQTNTKVAKSAQFTMMIAIIIAVTGAVFLGIFISRIISVPIVKINEAAEKLAAGDVDVNVVATTKDEIGNLTRSFAKMIENIREQG